MKKVNIIRFIFAMILLTILISILILLFCWFFYIIPFDFPGTVGEWITALSALSGGSLTLGGVWWTIKDQESVRRMDLAIQYRPILKLDFPPTKITTYVDSNVLVWISTQKGSIKYGDISPKLCFKLKNIGKGSAIISTVKKIELKSSMDIFHTNMIGNLTKILEPGEYDNITICLDKSKAPIDNDFDFVNREFIFQISIEYMDSFNLKTYDLTQSIHLIVTKNSNSIYSDEKGLMFDLEPVMLKSKLDDTFITEVNELNNK